MTTRLEKVIRDARYKLGDANGERWSTDRLLALANAAQRDIARQTKILKGTARIILQEGVYMYDLPDNVIFINRATFNNVPLALKTHDEMDSFVETANTSRRDVRAGTAIVSGGLIDVPHVTWDADIGSTPLALIYDNRDMGQIRVYPTPSALSDVSYLFEGGGPVEFVGDELVGVVAAIDDYTLNMPYGILVGLYDPAIENEVFSSAYGVVADIGESDGNIRIWYTRMPADLTSVFDTPELSATYDDAIMHYIVAHAYDDDVETRSVEKADRAHQFYVRDLKIPAAVSSRDGVSAPRAPSSGYVGPFDG